MDIKKKIIIKGQRVHDVGYRPYLLGIAESMEIERFFAKNIRMDEKQAVHVLVDSSEEKVKAFIDIVSSEYPEKSEVENVDVEDVTGNVMKIESYYRYLTAMQLSKIATIGGKMLDNQDISLDKQDKMLDKQDISLDKQDKMLDKQDKMLDKQDKMLEMQDKMLKKQDLHIEITRNGFDDLKSEFRQVNTEVKGIKNEIHLQRDDFKEIFLREVEELHNEINDIRATLARMQAA